MRRKLRAVGQDLQSVPRSSCAQKSKHPIWMPVNYLCSPWQINWSLNSILQVELLQVWPVRVLFFAFLKKDERQNASPPLKKAFKWMNAFLTKHIMELFKIKLKAQTSVINYRIYSFICPLLLKMISHSIWWNFWHISCLLFIRIFRQMFCYIIKIFVQGIRRNFSYQNFSCFGVEGDIISKNSVLGKWICFE